MGPEEDALKKLLFGLAMVGCTAVPAPFPDTADAASDAAPPSTGALNCQQILACATSACADGGTACVDDCISKGTPTGKKAVVDLAQCYQNGGCQDSTCLETKCSAELQACLDDSKPSSSGVASDGGAPPGMIPAELVGTWTEVQSSGTEFNWVFSADGAARYDMVYRGTFGSCVTISDFRDVGTAVFDTSAQTFTFYGTMSEQNTTKCGTPSTLPRSPETRSYTYRFVDAALRVIDAGCAQKYPGDQGSINLYCAVTYYKQ